MKTPSTLLALVLCALPLVAQNPERRVVAPCELITATVVASGKQTEAEGREFGVRVFNHSARTIVLPASPVFGWRAESFDKKAWHLKAEGGPVRRVSEKDEHIVVIGHPASTPLVEIPPNRSGDFYVSLPDAAKALQPDSSASTLKLTLYWAAPAAFAQSNPASSRLCTCPPVGAESAETAPIVRC